MPRGIRILFGHIMSNKILSGTNGLGGPWQGLALWLPLNPHYTVFLLEILDHVYFTLSGFAGYRWEELPPGTKICDLGGGLGHVSMHIAQTYSHVHVVLQDLPNTIAEAKHVWTETAPAVVTEGRVEFVPINFLEEAPVADCDYYFVSCSALRKHRIG